MPLSTHYYLKGQFVSCRLEFPRAGTLQQCCVTSATWEPSESGYWWTHRRSDQAVSVWNKTCWGSGRCYRWSWCSHLGSTLQCFCSSEQMSWGNNWAVEKGNGNYRRVALLNNRQVRRCLLLRNQLRESSADPWGVVVQLLYVSTVSL